MNGADLLCDTLLANGVDVCFANPGTSEMHFVAALDRKPQMRCILGLSEGVVTGAADGYGRMADKPAATLLHLGPGLANGLANLHNARRAGTGILNVVGEHATYHRALDAPLTSDIEGLARPMSGWVHTVEKPGDVGRATAEAIAATRDGATGRVATLILPADAAWGEVATTAAVPATIAPAAAPSDAAIRAAAEALRTGPAVLFLGGDALRDEALRVADRIARFTGARLSAQNANRRIQRGAGRVVIDRVPYPVDQSIAAFAGTKSAVLVGAVAPVAFFAYPGKPGHILPEGCNVVAAATPQEDPLATLMMLAEALKVPAELGPQLAAPGLPDAPRGVIDAASLAAAIGRGLPENAIVVDEAITNGREFFPLTRGVAPHDFLQLTGGAIGEGIPMATGAAVACPDRKVVGLQADGSGFYTLQALWTQAREGLDVTTVILANRRYAILRGELAGVGAGTAGRNASRMLDLDDPAADWVKLANGFGVEAVRVDTAEALEDVFAASMKRKGPFLIEAVMI